MMECWIEEPERKLVGVRGYGQQSADSVPHNLEVSISVGLWQQAAARGLPRFTSSSCKRGRWRAVMVEETELGAEHDVTVRKGSFLNKGEPVCLAAGIRKTPLFIM